jgi:hypothetical protein
MPAVSAPYGFRPIRSLGSRPFSSGSDSYRIVSGYATSLYVGTPVILGSTGKIEIGAANLAGYIGIFMGCYYEDTTFGMTFRQAWTGGTVPKDAANAVALIQDDPDLILQAQCSVVDFDAAAVVGKRLTINLPASPNHGNVATGNSKAGVTATVAAAGEFVLLGVVPSPDNINASGYVDVYGTIAAGLHITRKA